MIKHIFYLVISAHIWKQYSYMEFVVVITRSKYISFTIDLFQINIERGGGANTEFFGKNTEPSTFADFLT